MVDMFSMRMRRTAMRRTALRVAAAGLMTLGLVAVAQPAHAFTPQQDWSYNLRQEVTGRCLDVTNAANYNGAPLQRWDCGLQWNQQWLFTNPGSPTGQLSWQLRPRYTPGKCLDVYNGLQTAGTPVQIWDCWTGWQQRWIIDDQGWAIFIRAAYKPNLCLAIYDGSNSSGNGGTGIVGECGAPYTIFEIYPSTV
jgi:hypothetical protein